MHMDRAVFDLNMSKEATSLYILICAFLDEGVAPVRSRVADKWNGDEEDLSGAVEELIRYRVLEGPAPTTDEEAFRINPHDLWRRS